MEILGGTKSIFEITSTSTAVRVFTVSYKDVFSGYHHFVSSS